MPTFDTVLQQPLHATDSRGFAEWFAAIAEELLNQTDLVVAGQNYRFVEIEFYRFGEGHRDPFTHRDPVQRSLGQWYFHRTAGVYRSGSFKGLDLTFGDGEAFGGVLIRSIEAPDGTLVDGPSLCVDHLLAQTRKAKVAELDAEVGGRPAWEAGLPLRLQRSAVGRSHTLYRTPRVGLTLKKAKTATDMPAYLMRPYRYLSEPRRVKKGKAHMVLGLHAQGASAADIAAITGCPKGSVARYIADFEAGREEADFAAYFGKDLSPRDLCRLCGTCHARAAAPTAV